MLNSLFSLLIYFYLEVKFMELDVPCTSKWNSVKNYHKIEQATKIPHLKTTKKANNSNKPIAMGANE